ncbi:MAG: amidase [Thaumarchaeota archaeon]|nr:amidase [Nitrososphaerota archaeon]
MDIARLTLTSASRMLQAGDIKPSELISEFLGRIAKYDRLYKTFTLLMRRDAEKDAREKDSSATHVRGKILHGLPIGIKDIYDVKGVPTTAGTTVLPNVPARNDAPVVKRLRDAGAVFLGKLNMHEIALGVTSINPHYGTVRNPWNPKCMAGGSSGGSAAAIAASFCLGSLGTDTGGSIRIPASLTGTVGLKPTYGLVDRRGVVPLSWSFDHAGPMAKTVEDVSLLMEVLTGKRHHIDNVDAKRVRIGVPKEFFWDGIHKDVKRNLEVSLRVLEKIGFEVDDEVKFPHAAEARSVLLFILLSEASTSYDSVLSDVVKRRELGGDVLPRLDQGRMLLATQYLKAQQLKRVYVSKILRDVFSEYDALVTPTTLIPAPAIDEREFLVGREKIDVSTALTKCTAIFNLTGFPAIAMPNGFTTSGLPTGMQLASRPYSENLILQVAHSYELRARWHEKRMPELRTTI